MSSNDGYYWAYRKGSPKPDVVFVFKDVVYEILMDVYGNLSLDGEDLGEQKWRIGEKIVYSP